MTKMRMRLFIIVLGIFLAAIANAGGPGPCSNYGGWGCEAEDGSWCFQCGEVVNRSCHLVGDMNCFGENYSRHGLIIGAEGTQGNPIVIDGCGYKIDGEDVANRNCEVAVYTDGSGCRDHPCRMAKDLCGVDSGIFNARACVNNHPNNLIGGCDTNAPAGQGGCSFVTVKNLEITGWCDGIFMSGRCYDLEHNPNEVQLMGLLIEGNCIHDNGNGDCGDYTPRRDLCYYCGTWEHDYYNDGIFLAEAGLPKGCSPNDPNRVVVRYNEIYNQRGCIKQYCAGGDGINYCGTIGGGTGCSEIAHNICKHNAISGIMLSYFIINSRIHHNQCSGNLYGGIALI